MCDFTEERGKDPLHHIPCWDTPFRMHRYADNVSSFFSFIRKKRRQESKAVRTLILPSFFFHFTLVYWLPFPSAICLHNMRVSCDRHVNLPINAQASIFPKGAPFLLLLLLQLPIVFIFRVTFVQFFPLIFSMFSLLHFVVDCPFNLNSYEEEARGGDFPHRSDTAPSSKRGMETSIRR